MTSLNGLGFSITLLRVLPIPFNSHTTIIDLLDYPHETVGWVGSQANFWDATHTVNDFSSDLVVANAIEPSGLTCKSSSLLAMQNLKPGFSQ